MLINYIVNPSAKMHRVQKLPKMSLEEFYLLSGEAAKTAMSRTGLPYTVAVLWYSEERLVLTIGQNLGCNSFLIFTWDEDAPPDGTPLIDEEGDFT